MDWASLHRDHQRKGQLSKLIVKVLEAVEGKPLFALVRKDDEIVRDLVLNAGFKLAPTCASDPTGVEPTEDLYLRDESVTQTEMVGVRP